MSDSILFSRAEQAAEAYLVAKRATDLLDPLNIFTGQDADTKELPAVIVAAIGPGEPEPGLEFTGNFWFNFEVSVRYSAGVDVGGTAAAVKTANDALVAWVFDAMMSDDGPSQLSSFAGFTCIGLVPQSPNYEPSDGEAFNNTLSFRMFACPKDL